MSSVSTFRSAATFGISIGLRLIFLNSIGRSNGQFTDVTEFCDDGVGQGESKKVGIHILLQVLERKDRKTARDLRESASRIGLVLISSDTPGPPAQQWLSGRAVMKLSETSFSVFVGVAGNWQIPRDHGDLSCGTEATVVVRRTNERQVRCVIVQPANARPAQQSDSLF